MKFGEAVVSGLRNYFNFSGRASRSAFWFFLLFCILVPIVGQSEIFFLQYFSSRRTWSDLRNQ